MTPRTPRITTVHFFSFDLPATKLLVQPPSVGAVTHFDVGQPFAYNRHYSRVHAYAYTYEWVDPPSVYWILLEVKVASVCAPTRLRTNQL